jgi:hypothetical protein
MDERTVKLGSGGGLSAWSWDGPTARHRRVEKIWVVPVARPPGFIATSRYR